MIDLAKLHALLNSQEAESADAPPVVGVAAGFAPPEGGGDDDKILIEDSAKIKTGKYPKKYIQGAIKAAKLTGTDPYSLLALLLQEEGLGTHLKGRSKIGQAYDFEPEQFDELAKLSDANPDMNTGLLRAAIVLRDKIKYGKSLGHKDEASILQAYNGYGTVTKASFGGADRAYGVPIGNGINMGKNPVYGKRLVELKQSLMKNKDIQSLLK